MSFPKMPKGEEPAVTIRWQRRQMDQMEQELVKLRTQLTRSELRAGDLTLRVDSAEDALFKEQKKFETHKHEFAGYRAEAEKDKLELAYLRGYWDGRSETLLVEVQANGHTCSGPRDSSHLQDGGQAAPESQKEIRAEGSLGRYRETFRVQPAVRSAYPIGD